MSWNSKLSTNSCKTRPEDRPALQLRQLRPHQSVVVIFNVSAHSTILRQRRDVSDICSSSAAASDTRRSRVCRPWLSAWHDTSRQDRPRRHDINHMLSVRSLGPHLSKMTTQPPIRRVHCYSIIVMEPLSLYRLLLQHRVRCPSSRQRINVKI